MSRQRRIRDETGGSVYYDIDEKQAPACDVVQSTGAGVFDIMKNVASKLTGKAAKKMATKAAEKMVEKGASKVGEKTGQLLGEKIYNRFSQRVSNENKGDQIIKELQRGKKPHREVTSQRIEKSISQQFDDLLNL